MFFFVFFFAILVADEGFRIQKLEKTGVRHQRKNKGCEENPGLRAPGSDILNNYLKDKNAPRSGDRTRCFSFFASLVANEGLWMQKLAKTEVRHPKKKQRPWRKPSATSTRHNILNNNLKDKNAPRSGDRTRCQVFLFFCKLSSRWRLVDAKDGGNWSNTNKKHIETKTKPLKKLLGPNIPENFLLVSNVVVWYGEVEASSLQERKI